MSFLYVVLQDTPETILSSHSRARAAVCAPLAHIGVDVNGKHNFQQNSVNCIYEWARALH